MNTFIDILFIILATTAIVSTFLLFSDLLQISRPLSPRPRRLTKEIGLTVLPK